MRLLSLAALATCAATMSTAQEIDTSVDFTTLNRGAFVSEARNLAEASWVGSMEIFSRIDPSVAEKVPDFPWNPEFETAYGCIHDDMTAAGTIADYNSMRDASVTFMAFLENNPEVTLLNIDQYDEAIELMTPSETTISAMQRCGLMRLNQQAMIDSGLMQAVTQFYATQPQ